MCGSIWRFWEKKKKKTNRFFPLTCVVFPVINVRSESSSITCFTAWCMVVLLEEWISGWFAIERNERDSGLLWIFNCWLYQSRSSCCYDLNEWKVELRRRRRRKVFSTNLILLLHEVLHPWGLIFCRWCQQLFDFGDGSFPNQVNHMLQLEST